MSEFRVTECELGNITHRPGTALVQVERCSRGHFKPASYLPRRQCAACNKLAKYKSLYGSGQRWPARRAKRFTDYGDARSYYEALGGYLLAEADGSYFVSDSHHSVRVRRGRPWTKRCDVLGCWDEVELGG